MTNALTKAATTASTTFQSIQANMVQCPASTAVWTRV
jgi:hypothetical protein